MSERGPADPDCLTPPADVADRADPAPEAALAAALAQARGALRALFHAEHIDPFDAEDILQEALVVVLRRWQTIDDPPAFLLGTVRMCILNHRRKLQLERCVPLEAEHLDRLGGGECPQRQVDSRHDVRKLLARLPGRSRQIVALRYGDGLSPREIAQALDGSESGVRKMAHRGLGRLRRYAAAIRWRY